MKRLILAVTLCLVMLLPLVALAQTAISSGILATSANIYRGAGILTGVLILTDGSNAATVTVYDHAADAAGTVLFKATMLGASYFGGGTWEYPVQFTNGIYVSISGTGATAIIYYATGR